MKRYIFFGASQRVEGPAELASSEVRTIEKITQNVFQGKIAEPRTGALFCLHICESESSALVQPTLWAGRHTLLGLWRSGPSKPKVWMQMDNSAVWTCDSLDKPTPNRIAGLVSVP